MYININLISLTNSYRWKWYFFYGNLSYCSDDWIVFPSLEAVVNNENCSTHATNENL
jgi:hypothetical protein